MELEGSGVREPVASMPGVFRFSVDTLVNEVKELSGLGVPAVLLFGVPEHKDARGSGADAAQGVVQRATEAVKAAEPDLCTITDVCLCEYTDHGHCGIVEDGDVANDPSLERLVSKLTQAQQDRSAYRNIRFPGVTINQGHEIAAKFRQCVDSEDTLALLYGVGLDFERKRQFNKAAEVFAHIGERRRKYRDAEARLEKNRELDSRIVLGKDARSQTVDTLIITDGAVQKPVLGRYEVEKELGRGAMGMVYMGRDP